MSAVHFELRERTRKDGRHTGLTGPGGWRYAEGKSLRRSHDITKTVLTSVRSRWAAPLSGYYSEVWCIAVGCE